ncbi:MAG: hypothetical protein ABGZ37_02585 [Akkermansiaceae bacterium]
MNLKSSLPSLVLGIVALLSVSCSTQMYSGSRQPKENVARIRENSKQFMSAYFVTLWEVNGQRVHDTTFGIDVPPGRVRLTVLVHSPPSSANSVGYRTVHRTITVRAGHEYILDGSGGSLRVREQLNESLVDKLKKNADGS